MIGKILFVVTATREALDAVPKLAELAKALNAQIIAINVVDTSVARRLCRQTGQNESEVLVELEESGWKALYRAEDIAKKLGAKIVLQQADGLPQGAVVHMAEKLSVDLVVIPKGARRSRGQEVLPAEKLVVNLIYRLRCPLLVL